VAQYDPARRRRGIRKGRERGAWIYVPAAELQAAGVDPSGDAPWYRLWAKPRRSSAPGAAPGTVLVQLYAEE
jgi:hypothetical protein